MIKVAYNRRIQRPSLQFLNPNIQASNPLNITQGNPDLEPEYTNNYELSYSTFLKNVTLNFSGFVRNTTGAIQPLRSVLGQDTVYTTYENIGKEDAYGFSIFTNIDISKKFTLNGGIDTYYAVLDNNDPNPLYNASIEGWVVSGRMFGNYQFAKTWGLQFFAFARGRQVQLQGYQGSFSFYSLNIKKDFNDKKGSIGIGADNFLTTAFKIRSEVVSPTITQNSTNVMNNMSFKINFSYQIGKLDVNPQSRRRKSIQNNDLKEGGNNDQPMSQ
jgi:outer membrane receptor protein involved in Fe transport